MWHFNTHSAHCPKFKEDGLGQTCSYRNQKEFSIINSFSLLVNIFSFKIQHILNLILKKLTPHGKAEQKMETTKPKIGNKQLQSPANYPDS